MRMRRIMAFVALLSIIVLLTLTLAGCGLLGGEYTYHKLPDGTVKITKYNGKAETLEVPGELGGKTVTGIGDYAFSDCVRLRSVKLPDSVTSIGQMAFFSCRYLTSCMFLSSSDQECCFVPQRGQETLEAPAGT